MKISSMDRKWKRFSKCHRQFHFFANNEEFIGKILVFFVRKIATHEIIRIHFDKDDFVIQFDFVERKRLVKQNALWLQRWDFYEFENIFSIFCGKEIKLRIVHLLKSHLKVGEDKEVGEEEKENREQKEW